MWWLALVLGTFLILVYVAYVCSIQHVIDQRIQLAEEAAEFMVASMQADGVPTTAALPDDGEPAAIPFLAILPDNTLHVAVLEKDVFADTAPLATRTLPLPLVTAGGSSRTLSTPQHSMARAGSERFVPVVNPIASSSFRGPSESGPLDATGGPSAPSTSIAISRPGAQPLSQPGSGTVSGRLRRFGLAALPSLRRAELADIPDSLVWSVAVVTAAAAGNHPHLARAASASSRSFRLSRTRSLRSRDAASSHVLLSSRSSVRAGAHGRSRAGTSPLQKSTSMHQSGYPGGMARSQALPGDGGASAPLPMAPRAAHLPEDAAPGGTHVAGSSAVHPSDAGGAAGQAYPGQPQRTRSLRKGRSLRSAGGDGYERLADVHELPENTQ